MNIVLILFWSLIFVLSVFAGEKPHANLYRGDDKSQAIYCSFCHKLRSSSNITAKWKMDKNSSYQDYISATITNSSLDLDIIEMNNTVSSIVDLCLSCHDMTKHDNNYGHSFTAKVIGNKKTKIKAKVGADGKVANKLKLYNNIMTCTTCHDPHSSNFKLLTDSKDKLCNECHDK